MRRRGGWACAALLVSLGACDALGPVAGTRLEIADGTGASVVAGPLRWHAAAVPLPASSPVAPGVRLVVTSTNVSDTVVNIIRGICPFPVRFYSAETGGKPLYSWPPGNVMCPPAAVFKHLAPGASDTLAGSEVPQDSAVAVLRPGRYAARVDVLPGELFGGWLVVR